MRMEAIGFTKHVRRTFHDTPYLLTASGDNETLSIEVEHTEDGRKWRSKFAATFIEEITQRTGNAKKFDIFVRMLLSALAQESDSVYVDILTARDLEMLRRHANPQGPPTTSTAGYSDKRYLILTYRAEFDKVHYPLPLPLEQRSEEDKLRAVVSRLQSELGEARQTIASLDRKASVGEPSGADERLVALQQQNTELSDALRVARREVEQLRSELRQRLAPAAGGDAAEAHKLKTQCSKLQVELKAMRDDVRQREGQHRQREKDLRAEKQKVEKLQQQVRKLEEERRSMGLKLQNAERRPSTERSRPASCTPSAERARPASRPMSRPASRVSSRPGSRASSVASSRERTPSPSSLLHRSGSAAHGGVDKPWAFRQERPSGSGGRRAASPATLSPYRRPVVAAGPGRRTPSPGQRSRDRTPSPGAARGGQAPGSIAVRPPVSLRDRGGTADAPPCAASARGPGRGARPSSSARQGVRLPDGSEHDSAVLDGRSGSRGPQSCARGAVPGFEDHSLHRPGSLFGLAANLGLGPGSMAVAASASSSGTAVGAACADDAETCDIDARLQALQSFLKQTKHIAA